MKLRLIILMTALLIFLSACDGWLKESAQVTGGVGAGLSEYQE